MLKHIILDGKTFCGEEPNTAIEIENFDRASASSYVGICPQCYRAKLKYRMELARNG